MRDASYLLLLLALLLASLISRRDAKHTPIAVLLALAFASDLFRRLTPLPHPGPYEGTLRLLFHARQLAFLAWPLSLPLLTSKSLDQPIPLLALLLPPAAILPAFLAYPALRDAPLATHYLLVQLASLALTTRSLAKWAISLEPTRPRHPLLALVVAIEAVMTLTGPWRHGIFVAWDLAQAAYCVLFGLLVLVQGAWLLWTSSPWSSGDRSGQG
jgi:hypothetical protein